MWRTTRNAPAPRTWVAAAVLAAVAVGGTAAVRAGVTPVVPTADATATTGDGQAAQGATGSDQAVTVYLTPADRAGLHQLARSIPTSGAQPPRVRADRLAAFLPPPTARETVATRLRELGLTVARTSTWSVTATGSASRVRDLFGSARNTRPTLRYAQSLPALPAPLHGLVSVAVGGDETRPAFRHLSTPTPPAALPTTTESATAAPTTESATGTVPPSTPSATPARGTDSVPADAGYNGPQLRAAYAAPDGRRVDGGPDPTVATLHLSGWDPADLRAYSAAAGIADPVEGGRYTAVGVGRSPDYDPANDGDGDAEVALGQQALLAVAPTARQRLYIAPNTDEGFLEVLDRVRIDAADPATNLVALSTSWGLCETHNSAAFMDTAETLLAAISAAGVTIFAASGDRGSDDCGDGTTGTSYPASSPSVVAVGGTTLQRPTDPSPSETAWSGSGGGCSTLFARPAWQPHTGCDNARALPDIAVNADPMTGFAVHNRRYWERYGGSSTRGWVRFGGTSLAAPVAAGMLAAVWAGHGETGGGFGSIHERLYSAPSGAFRDITTGGNGAHQAAAGYDRVTGLGAPRWDRLASAVTGRAPAYREYAARERTVAAGVGTDHAVWQQRSDQAGPTSLGGQATSTPTVVSTAGREIFIVGGTDYNLWMRTEDDSAWSPLGPPGTRCFGQAATVLGATLHVGCRGADRSLYVASVPISSSGRPFPITSWWNYGGQTGSAPAVAVVDGVVTWFVTGTDHAPAANLYRRTAASDWQVLEVRCDGGPGGGANGDGLAFIGCRLPSGSLAYAAAPFTRFVEAGGNILGSPAFAPATDGAVDAFVSGVDSALYRRRLSTSAPQDGTWTRLGGTYLLAAGAARIDQWPDGWPGQGSDGWSGQEPDGGLGGDGWSGQGPDGPGADGWPGQWHGG